MALKPSPANLSRFKTRAVNTTPHSTERPVALCRGTVFAAPWVERQNAHSDEANALMFRKCIGMTILV